MIGNKLLHYEIVEKLGEGGMGEVYRSRDTKLGREVAIKVLPEDLSTDPERRRRFEQEARVIAALNHPNIVTVHSVDEVDGRHFITMELVKGRTLREFIVPEGVSLGMFFSVAVPLVDAMCSAHAQGITHRDLKPANIMVNEEGRIKVLDFGLAKLLEQATDIEDAPTVGHVTGDGQILGTVSYMSPEQVEGKPLDGRSDIFSLGIVFYEMLTGQRPFKGDSNASTISSILRDTPPPVTELRETLPHHLGRIIRRCLAKDPDRRYQSPLDLRNDLQELAEEVDSGSLGSGYGQPADSGGVGAGPAPAASTAAASSDSIVLPGSRRAYKWLLGAIAIAAVAAIVVTIGRVGSPDDSRPESAAEVEAGDMTLGVIGFENLSDPEDRENLGRVLMGLVTTGLAESGGLKVASTAKVLGARRQVGAGDRVFDASLASDAAREAGADVMLVGQVIRDGERMILTAELVDVGSGNALGSLRKAAASSSELFELAGAIASEVRQLMGVARGEAATAGIDLAEALTSSPEAYRQFAAGEVAVHQGHYDEAVKLFDQAIRVDSTFALAYLRLNLAYTWNGETRKGLAVLMQGLRHVGRLPERWQIVYEANIDYYEGHASAAHDRLVRLLETSPNIPDAYNLLGEIATHCSQYQDVRRAREYFERALEIDPTFEIVFFHLVDDYLWLNDVAAIEKLVARYLETNPTDRRVADARLALLEAQQRFDEVIEQFDDRVREGDLSGWDDLSMCLRGVGEWARAFEVCQQAIDREEKGYNLAFAFAGRGMAQIGRGNLRPGLADLDQASAIITAMGGAGRWAASIVANYYWLKAHILLSVADFEGSIAAARRGVEHDPRFTPAYGALLTGQLAMGRKTEAEKTFRELERIRQGNSNPSDGFTSLLAQAQLDAARGDTDGALAAIRRAEAMPIETRIPQLQWAVEGDVKAKAGDIGGAIVSYRKVLESREFLLPPNTYIAMFRLPYYYKLARLEEQTGQIARARENYRTYLDCWGDADIEVPDAETARARLDALIQ